MIPNHIWAVVTDKLRAFAELSEDDLVKFRSLWTIEKRERKVILTSAGGVEKYMYFVVSGTQRIYHIDDSGKESTLVLMYEGDFGGVLDSMVLGRPSNYFYETLSSSELMRCSISELRAQIVECPSLQKILEIGSAYALSGMMERMVELQSLSIEDRFRNMMKRSSHVLHLIPHKYIASYLGIDPTNFSKLVNSIKI